MDEWQRSVKRKYDSLIAEESQKSRKNDKVTFTQSPDLLTSLVDNSSYRVVCAHRTDDENEKLESNLQLSELPLSYRDSCCGLEEDFMFNHSTYNAEQKLVLLRKALQVKHKVLNALYTELEEERNASAVAASEAINVIARLQEEKSAMQMEIQHCKMMAEVKGTRDEEAITLLKDILMRKDEEIFDLMDEIEVYRKVLKRFELEGWGKDSCQRILCEIVGKDTGLHLLDGKEESMSVSECFHSSANSYWHDTSEDVGNRASSEAENMHSSQPYSGGLIFDNVRRDVASMFDTANSGWEEKHQPVHVPEKLAFVDDRDDEGSRYSASFKGDASKDVGNLSKRRFCLREDPKSWREKESEELGFAEEKCALSHVQYCTQLDIEGRVVVGTEESQDQRKAIFGVNFSTCAIEEQEDQYVWERLRKLEERIKILGEQQKHQREWLNEKTKFLHNDWISNKAELFVIGSNEVAQKHWKQLKGSKNLRSQSSRNSSANTSGSSSALSGANIFQNSHSSEKLLMADHAWKNAFTQDIIPEESFNGGSLDIESEGSCIEEQGDIGEGMHDVFEVSHTFMRSRSLLSEESYKNNCATIDHEKCPRTSSEGSISWEIGDSCPDECGAKTIPMCIKESPSVHELGLVANTVFQSVTCKCRSVEAFDAASTQISIPGEVQQLTMRLQALETERVFMKQAIESLRKENGELRLLREIAQQLCELKGMAENPEQPKERIRWQQLSFLSFFKNLFAFGCLQSCIHPQNLKSGSSLKTNMDPGIPFKKHAGLSFLLEESAASRMVACVTRGLKVKLPFLEEELIYNKPFLKFKCDQDTLTGHSDFDTSNKIFEL